MDYRKGYTIKPAEVTSTGEVLFTNGTQQVLANQVVCEAYGYDFNVESGTCSAYRYNSLLNNRITNKNNKINGQNNNTERNSNNLVIIGSSNTTKGNNTNILITGERNEIQTGINNSSIIAGSLANVINQGEVVLGGGGFNNSVGLSQQSFIQQSGKTTDATETALLTQYLPLTYIQKVANSVIAFEVNVIGVNYGGGAGEVGEYGYFQLTGAVQFTNGLASDYHQTVHALVPHGHSGLNLTGEMKDVTATSFGVNVTGAAETNIQWTASIKLWQNKLTTTF